MAGMRLLDAIRERETYIGQYELIAAIVPFVSLPAEWFHAYPVELWIDNSGAIGAILKGYSGKPDCARIVNTFKFAMAKLGVASLWIDYVPSESNPADIPSRFHEMTAEEREAARASLGEEAPAIVPAFADDEGNWLSFVDIAQSIWQ